MQMKKLFKTKPSNLLVVLLTLLSSSLLAQNPSTGTWNAGASQTVTDKAVGIGITAPRGWQEILFCPPANQDHNGLIVTKFKCSNPLLPPTNQDIDVIGGGIDGNTKIGGSGNVFIPPFSYQTGFLTSPVQPLYSSTKPLIWARLESPPLTGNTIPNDPSNSYDTKFIVLPDGSCGINITKPRAALDVRGSNSINRPAAIIGARALGTNTNGSNGLLQFNTQHIEFIPKLSAGGYDNISQQMDQGIIFTDGMGADGANENGALVIAPWSIDQNAVTGIRIDAAGHVGIASPGKSGYRLAVNGKIICKDEFVVSNTKVSWPDYVFENYNKSIKPIPLLELKDSIQANEHLPEIPSAQEIKEVGVNLVEMNVLLLKKIEEMTIYMIDLQEQVNALKEEQDEKYVLYTSVLAHRLAIYSGTESCTKWRV